MKMTRFVAALVSCVLCAVAIAQPSFVVSSPASKAQGGHVWTVSRGTTPISILHLPPELSGAKRVSESGVPVMRVASAGLRYEPNRAAALDDYLYMFFETPEGKAVANFPPAPAQPTRVVSFRAEWMGDRWLTTPMGRPASEPNLPAGRPVMSAAGSAGTLYALLAPGGLSGEKVHVVSLMAMDVSAWREVATPAGVTLSEKAAIFAVDGGVGIIDRGGDLTRAWIGSVEKRAANADFVGPPAPTRGGAWQGVANEFAAQWRELALPDEWASSVSLQVAGGSGQLVIARAQGEGLQVRSAFVPVADAKPVWRELGSVNNLGGDPELFVDGARGWAMVISTRTLTDVERKYQEPPYLVSALSLATGSMVVQGPVSVMKPFEVSDLTFLAISLGWMLGLVALVVIRPPMNDGAGGSWMLPMGVSLAEPMRRFLAWSIDLILVVMAGGLLVGKAPMQTLTASLGDIIGTSQGQGMLLAIVGTGVIGCSVFEAALGRTPGKFLANCQVVRLVRGANNVEELRNPSLAQALVRNLIKWIFPPVAFVIFRDGAQHRGEQYSKTAVIVPWVEELDEEEDE